MTTTHPSSSTHPSTPPQSADAFISWLGEDFASNPHPTSSHSVGGVASITSIVPRPLRYVAMIAASSLVAGLVALVWLSLAGRGIRADYLVRLAESVVMAKQAIPLVIAGFALPLILRLSLPEGRTGNTFVLLILACLVLPVMAGVHLLLTPMGEWGGLIAGRSRLQCMVFVPLLSLLLTAAQIVSLRHWAVTKPLLTGAIVGVLSGATATMIYALFCVEDAPGFYGFWYSAGILASASIGAVAGGKWLRW